MDVEAFTQMALVRPGIALVMAVPGFRDMLRGSGIRPFVDLRLLRVSLHGLAAEQLTLAGVHGGGEQALLDVAERIAAMRNRKPLFRGDAELRASAWEDGTGVDRGLAVHGGAFVIAARTAMPGLLGTQQPAQQVPRLSSLRDRVALLLTVEDASRYLPGVQPCGLQALRASIAVSGERPRLALSAYYRAASLRTRRALAWVGSTPVKANCPVSEVARPRRERAGSQQHEPASRGDECRHRTAAQRTRLGAAQCVAESHALACGCSPRCATTPPAALYATPASEAKPTAENSPPDSAEQLLARYASGERNFDRVQLHEAALSSATLVSASFRAADLSGADLRAAKLEGSDLSEANLQGAHLESAYVANATLRAAQLERAHLFQTVLWASDLSSAVLDGAQLDQANLEHADLSDAHLRGASLKKALLATAVLRGADLTGANLSAATLPNADLESANLAGANLSYADLGSAYLQGADLRAALLCGTVLPKSAAQATLQGARYGKGTRLPAGFDAKAHGAVEDPCCAAKDFESACAAATTAAVP